MRAAHPLFGAATPFHDLPPAWDTDHGGVALILVCVVCCVCASDVECALLDWSPIQVLHSA